MLVSGIIKLYKISSGGKKLILKYFYPNELIGEVANFEQMPYPATALAFENVEVIKIDFKKLEPIINSNPKLLLKIQKSLIQKVKNLEKLISSDLVLDARERVAKYICESSDKFFAQKNMEIAEILNITPETLSRMLKEFKSAELVNMKKRTIDKEKLSRYFKI
jgi:CRP/FNR family transcriptional regulator